ncbi:A/G-specific adenine glycosylase [Bartonella henselae]|uniref:A/G-specific adenine glycosylase n=1 Tax=Bartonella henselae TaxID=38323 RepID=UPI000963DA09|nr:A/G-specific adenine glycosylase [Bartonella henselae]OLL54027.1 A/G-specific adenine glycosylase [Bartonella henselae]OLL54327.1 A/G-specific adenine glycosylase [Bartonella henselae]UJM32827.1 A/G-specific adenine glycosylase [Bartonella henselae]
MLFSFAFYISLWLTKIMHEISLRLLSWYDQKHRHLPWRITPKEQMQGIRPDPYRVWLSEIMLQQTTVEAVKPYFKKFLQLWPDLSSLAKASQDDIMKAWAGLGYYSRARNLKNCAQQLVENYGGQFPQSIKVLRSLSGIGDYTAAAIAAIAFNHPVAVVDSNVERVVTRLFAITSVLPKAKAEIKEKTQKITALNRPGDFAQAMMDLGATICIPRKPSCSLCPLQGLCRAEKMQKAELFPVKAPKKERLSKTGAAFVVLNEKRQIYLEKRQGKKLLGGMTQIPNNIETKNPNGLQNAPFIANWQFKGQITHVFTHFSLKLDVYYISGIREIKHQNGWWCDIHHLAEQALPTVMKKAIAVAIPHPFKLK